jgi:ubiquitin-protein ligase
MTWYELDKARLVLEFERVKARFSSFSLKRRGKQLFWEGQLCVNVGGVNADLLELQLTYPEAFPSKPPNVGIIKPVLDPSEVGHQWHRWNEGNICLVHPREWNIATTGDEVIEKTADWYFNYVALKRGLIAAMPDLGRADVGH